ncbi:hypothetical protein MBANPS3_002709 [Mucor bainieri]
MTTGTLTVSPHSIQGFPMNDYPDSTVVVSFSVTRGTVRNTRYTPVYDLNWDVALDLSVPEGENTLTIRVDNGSFGPLTTVKVELDQIFSTGSDSRSIALKSDEGRSLGELKLGIKFDVSVPKTCA